MARTGFYDEGELSRVAINLFYGWGYNFYRKENQLRADDQLVRSKAAWLLGLAQADVARAESDYRLTVIAPPSRAHPFPDPAAVAVAQAIERVGRSIGALIGRIEAQPVPETDRMTQRYRQEATTLVALGRQDERLVGQCQALRAMIEGRDGAGIGQDLADLQAGVAAIEATLRDRAAILHDDAV
jgi:hypothetical protein